MSWTEWTETSFRGLDLRNLKVDQAYLNVSNALNKKFYLYALTEECIKCPFKKLHNISKSQETLIKLDVERNLELRLFDKDFGDYAFPNQTSDGLRWSAKPDLGQFGVYDLQIMAGSEAIKFDIAKEPVSIYACK